MLGVVVFLGAANIAVCAYGNLHNMDRLMIAIKDNNIGAVRALLPNIDDAELDLQDENEFTALHYAALRNEPKIVNMLLLEGANPNKENMFGMTPLHYAAENINPEMMEILLHRGANPNVQDDKGETPLHIIIREYEDTDDARQCVDLLLQAGTNLQLSSNKGRTPWQFANHAARNRFHQSNDTSRMYQGLADLLQRNEDMQDEQAAQSEKTPSRKRKI